MFRYLWRHKAFSAVLLSFFAASACVCSRLPPGSGLALLLFLRLTKVHSLLLIYDLTDRAALKHMSRP